MGIHTKPRGYDENLKRSWVDQFYTEVEHVQQRFNFFLIAISFMFLAFVTLVSGTPIEKGTIIAILVGVAGAGISLYFFIVNYCQAEVARIVGDQHYCEPIPDKEKEPTKWIHDGWYHAWAYFYPPKALEYAKSRPVSYTWFIPFAFFLLWLIILGIWWGYPKGLLVITIPLAFQILVCCVGKRRSFH